MFENIDVIELIIAVVAVGIVGLILGFLIGVANKFLEVKVHPMVEQVYEMLPHFNCGACGTPGCMANAEEIVHNNQPLSSCKPGTADMRRNIQTLLDDWKSGKLQFDEDKKEKTAKS